MTTARVVETSVTNNSLSEDYVTRTITLDKQLILLGSNHFPYIEFILIRHAIRNKFQNSTIEVFQYIQIIGCRIDLSNMTKSNVIHFQMLRQCTHARVIFLQNMIFSNTNMFETTNFLFLFFCKDNT